MYNTVLGFSPYLLELLKRVFRSKDKLEQHHFAVAAGPTLGVIDVGGHPVQDGGADDL